MGQSTQTLKMFSELFLAGKKIDLATLCKDLEQVGKADLDKSQPKRKTKLQNHAPGQNQQVQNLTAVKRNERSR